VVVSDVSSWLSSQQVYTLLMASSQKTAGGGLRILRIVVPLAERSRSGRRTQHCYLSGGSGEKLGLLNLLTQYADYLLWYRCV
jgi:hypothetical protein